MFDLLIFNNCQILRAIVDKRTDAYNDVSLSHGTSARFNQFFFKTFFLFEHGFPLSVLLPTTDDAIKCSILCSDLLTIQCVTIMQFGLRTTYNLSPMD